MTPSGGREQPVVVLERVTRTFPGRSGGQGGVAAVDSVGLSVGPRESIALVGRSGAGKTTLARLIVGLEPPDAGSVRVLGRDLADLRGRHRRAVLSRIGMVSQDPYAALSPSMSVLEIVLEPLRIAGIPRPAALERAIAALADVGLDDERFWQQTSDELSGGERQRVGLARAIAPRPALLLADEPTSMLDATRQQEFLDLLRRIRAARSMALLYITHDLALAAAVCDRLAVIEAGRIVEDGPTVALLAGPAAPATQALVAAARARSAMLATASAGAGVSARLFLVSG
jgi:ABC-type glutathione transport system ATPase component